MQEPCVQSQTGQGLLEMHQLLLDHFGPQEWWPGETPLEIMVGAVLTQNTNWTNVEKAIQNLKAEDLLSLKAQCLECMAHLSTAANGKEFFARSAAEVRQRINALRVS